MKHSTRYILEVWLSIGVLLAALTGVAYSVPQSLATQELVLKVIQKGGAR